MNPPKCDDLDYIHFIIAAQKAFTCTEAARCQPQGEKTPAHDAFTRLLQRQPPNTEALRQETKAFWGREGAGEESGCYPSPFAFRAWRFIVCGQE